MIIISKYEIKKNIYVFAYNTSTIINAEKN